MVKNAESAKKLEEKKPAEEKVAEKPPVKKLKAKLPESKKPEEKKPEPPKPVGKAAEKFIKKKLPRPPKKKKPKFRRSEGWRYTRIKERWRSSRGIDSKMRLKRKGHMPILSIGYRTPRRWRELHPSGFEEVLIYNPDDLKTIDSKKQAARIAHTVGARKRIEILEEARKRELLVLNPRGVKIVEPKEPEKTSS